MKRLVLATVCCRTTADRQSRAPIHQGFTFNKEIYREAVNTVTRQVNSGYDRHLRSYAGSAINSNRTTCCRKPAVPLPAVEKKLDKQPAPVGIKPGKCVHIYQRRQHIPAPK